jgi:hypothetical protein
MIKCNNYVEIDGTYYVLDMDALSKYIVSNDNGNVVERTKSEQWVASENPDTKGDMELVTKDITETSQSRRDEHAPFRAEVAKMLLSLIMYPTVSDSGESITLKSLNDPMTIGQVIAFNTLLEEGIIKEIIVEEDEEE